MVRCKDCKYSEKIEGVRYCKRFPPAVRLDNPDCSGYISAWPIVENNDTCGEGVTE
jgi:hypothetical protein